MNRGSGDLGCGENRVRIASMRPRFMNRGSEFRAPNPSSAASRFNEAPIHESGKSSRIRAASDRHARFNEAPIHESGKCGAHSRRRSWDGCFNEAPIHESGK